MDYRDSNSETSSCDGELEKLSDQASWSSSDAGERMHEGESLIFEYFESAAPSLRVPLSDKLCSPFFKFSFSCCLYVIVDGFYMMLLCWLTYDKPSSEEVVKAFVTWSLYACMCVSLS